MKLVSRESISWVRQVQTLGEDGEGGDAQGESQVGKLSLNKELLPPYPNPSPESSVLTKYSLWG